jgi:transcriptional regulator with XRE-family HTH domain
MIEMAAPVNGTAPGVRLAHLRRVRGWSQRMLAGQAGLSPSTVSRIESGHRTIRSWAVADALAAALGCPIDELLDVSSQVPPLSKTVPPVCRVLIGTGLQTGIPAVFHGWSRLETLAGLAADRRAGCAYRAASQVLPEAVEQAHAALAVERERALRVVARVCVDTSAVALGQADTAVAWIAAVRAAAAAEESGDPVLIGTAQLMRAEVARREQASGQSLDIATAYLAAAPRLPVTTAVRGWMHLVAGLAAAYDRSRRHPCAERHLDLAEELTRGIDAGGDPSGLDFSAAVVWQVRLRMALARADLDAAAVAVGQVDADRLVALSNRAAYLIDLARMQLLLSRHSHAVHLVERAFQLAPEYVACAPASQALLADMVALCLPARAGRQIRSIYRRTQLLSR